MKFRFLPFVVVTIVATVFFSAVFAARAPAMGNSADRAWQLSQLVEGVLTACNPSHGSLFRRGPRARCARFPTCGVVRVAGYSVVWDCDPTPHISPKEHQKERCGHFRSQRSFITFYGALWNILLSAGFPAMFHMIAPEQTFAALCKKFLSLMLLNRIDSIPASEKAGTLYLRIYPYVDPIK